MSARRFMILSMAVITMILSFSTIRAHEINIYFDAGLSVKSMDCPGPILDTLYVATEGFNEFMIAFEFKVNLPPSIIWLADFGTPPATLGATVTGIEMEFSVPQSGFSPIALAKMIILWNCVSCSSTNEIIQVVEHPVTSLLGGDRWPDFVFIPAAGGTAIVCLTVAVEESTWGKIKELYSQ